MGNLGPYIELMHTTKLFSLGASVRVCMSMTVLTNLHECIF